ncbi:MAG TPA: serine hydrolase domain-containing protein [Thermoanaerobaculia bacterium]|nr:serine hydrolase domain-containing protein [Thermoanaerobaculia bacterium]
MSLSSGTTKKINEAIATFMNGNPVVGLILSVQQAGKTVFENSYGVATKGGSAPTPATSFQIDSLTKAFTAIGVLHLWETGAIAKLTDTYGTYVPNLPNKAWGGIQIDQMLAMCSGIPDISSGTETYQEVLHRAAQMKLLFPPGAQYLYSDPTYMLLGVLIAAITKTKFGEWIVPNVLTPLSMPSTGFIDESSANDPATPYLKGQAVAWRNPLCGFSAGGFTSTMSDLESFAIGLANGAILKSSTYELMWTNFTLNDGSADQFGYGWNVVTSSGDTLKYAAKDGGGWGWASDVAYAPASSGSLTGGTSVCLMMTGGAKAYSLGPDLLEIVLDAG